MRAPTERKSASLPLEQRKDVAILLQRPKDFPALARAGRTLAPLGGSTTLDTSALAAVVYQYLTVHVSCGSDHRIISRTQRVSLPFSTPLKHESAATPPSDARWVTARRGLDSDPMRATWGSSKVAPKVAIRVNADQVSLDCFGQRIVSGDWKCRTSATMATLAGA